MRIYIVRHADAVPQMPRGTDAERMLSEKGRKEAARLGQVMCRLEIQPDQIWTSPYTRTRETTDLICRGLDAPTQVVEQEFLACPGDFEMLRTAIRKMPLVDSLMLVGHMPFVGECVQYWSSGHAHPGMHLATGTLVELRADGFLRGHMELRMMLSPKYIRKIAKLIG